MGVWMGLMGDLEAWYAWQPYIRGGEFCMAWCAGRDLCARVEARRKPVRICTPYARFRDDGCET